MIFATSSPKLGVLGATCSFVIATLGCVEQLSPPVAPAREIPALPEQPPAAPPAAGHARVILDAAGEKAWVSRVTGSTAPVGYKIEDVGTGNLRLRNGDSAYGVLRTDELLCVAPCVVDLRAGAHEFVFSHPDEPGHETTTTVVLPSNTTTVVRHKIGRTPHYNGSYLGGAILTLMGAGFTFVGGTMTALGAALPTRNEVGQPTGADTVLTLGLVSLGIGLATGIPGLLMLTNNRPSEQSGATTTWALPR